MQLDGWRKIIYAEGTDKEFSLIWGFVYGNPKFPDGTYVHTSGIEVMDMNKMMVKTKNSIYELLNPDSNMRREMAEQNKHFMDLHTGDIDE